MSGHGKPLRKTSVSSERTLDNLEVIPSNLPSPTFSPPGSYMDPSLGPDYRAGHGRPPHHGRDSPVTVDPPRGREAHRPGAKVSWQDPTSRETTVYRDARDDTSQFSFEYVESPSSNGSPIRSVEITRVATGSDSSPVRRLKTKDSANLDRMQRELSDSYIDSISRTPRYGYDREKSYDERLEQMNPEDPFGGEYKPSGKSPRVKRSKLPKPEQKQKEAKPLRDENVLDRGFELQVEEKKAKRRKRAKPKRSNKSGDDLKEYHVNAGYSDELDNKKISIENNGTFIRDFKAVKRRFDNPMSSDILQNETFIFSSSNGDSVPLKKVKSEITAFTKDRITRQEEMDQQKLVEFVNNSSLSKRTCHVYVPNKKAKDGSCMCGRSKEFENHSKEDSNIWHFKTHTMPEPTDSFGIVQFEGFGKENLTAPYIRLDPVSDMEQVWDLLTKHWQLPIPKLLISVTGGAQRFELNNRLKAVFKRGLINAAVTTGAWIITGGTGTGVMQFVGEAVQDQIITRIKGENKVVAIGIATWGCIANREALDGDISGLFPAHYLDVSEVQGRDIPLDHNHTHFLLVDDGTEGKFGAEITFRSEFERYVSAKVETGVAESQSVNVPVIQLVVEGGVNTMQTVWNAVSNDIPVLVLKGSGRAADFIAEGYNLSRDRKKEEISRFSKEFDEAMKEYAECVFAWKPSDDKDKKIAECLKQLKDTLGKRKLVNVFCISQADTKDIDRAILYALLKANMTNASAQLALALAWNRCDIARHEIFTQANRQHWKNLPLYQAMFTALVQDRVDFVHLFLENGVSLRKFLSIETLWNLYANVLMEESDTMAQLLNNLMSFLKQSWGAYLSCKVKAKNQVVDGHLLVTIGKLMVHLLGDENCNPYPSVTVLEEQQMRKQLDSYAATARTSQPYGNSMRYEMEKPGMRPTMEWLPGNHEEKMNSYLTEQRYFQSAVPNTIREKRKRAWTDFHNCFKELFIFAILLNRRELGKLMWHSGQDQIGSALIACAILKALAQIADAEEELELSLDLLDHANMYEDMAYGVLSECYKRDKHMAHQLLVQRLEPFGNTTLFALADTNTLMKFMGHTCCQTKLNLIWKGRMALYTQSWKIVLSLLMPLFILTIKFTTSEGLTEEEAEYDALHEGEEEVVAAKEEVKIIENKVAPNDPNDGKDDIFVSSKSRRNRKPAKKLYKVNMFGDKRQGTIGIVDAIYYFYTAPVTVFTANTLHYVIFLGLFSYFVLVDLKESTTVIEYVVWGWTLTMFTEEIRQLISNDRRSLLYKVRAWFSSLWNKFDLTMYMIFILSVILRFTLTGDKFVYARIFYSITVAMYYLRFMQTFFVEKNIGPKVIMIKNMLIDLLFFMGIFIVFLLSFGIMYQANLFPNSPPSWYLLKSVVYIPYWQMYGELFLEDLEGDTSKKCTTNESIWRPAGGVDRCPEDNGLVPFLGAIYLILTNILLVNLLIAMFSYTFQTVQDKSEQVWRFYRYSLVHEFYERPVFCPPLIILSHIYRVSVYVLRKGCNRGKYKNEFKLKLDEKDTNRLTLFVRGATESYLTNTSEAQKEELGNKVSDTAVRLEKVIEELDTIKESVKQSKISPIMDENRSTLDLEPLTPRRTTSGISSALVSQLQEQVDDLSQQVAETSLKTNQIFEMMQMLFQQQQQTLNGTNRDSSSHT